MYTTTQLDNGLLNNYAVEPKPYYAQYPAPYQQRRYLIQGALLSHSRSETAALFITSLVIVSAVIS
ncbi:photosystem II assembly protein Psb34 [Crocosphaera sp. XPORK-15E]|uniref:photosystem II assembly protein Psb34 n=1 Tax=Crocosphaera sp. XPORK-15E TaxID=3110247 RepID=UPI002B20DD20|nr:ssl1498 family light-harvesting-like protein [Crocosphaera sp. XPORK-15E]MEA5537068.1 ssl1498 family light-harvesting-like protein [Crocosphaera sp. XPORK-15E]